MSDQAIKHSEGGYLKKIKDMGDGTYAEAVYVGGGVGVITAAALADATANPTVPTTGACLLVFNGSTWDRMRTPSKFTDLNAVSVTAIATVWTPAAGKKVRLMGGTISVSAAGSLLLEDNAAGTTAYRSPKLLADTPYNFDLGNGVLLSAADHVLKGTLSVAGTVTGTLYGVEE